MPACLAQIHTNMKSEYRKASLASIKILILMEIVTSYEYNQQVNMILNESSLNISIQYFYHEKLNNLSQQKIISCCSCVSTIPGFPSILCRNLVNIPIRNHQGRMMSEEYDECNLHHPSQYEITTNLSYWHRGKLSQYPHICPNILRNKAISILHSISLICPDLVFQKGTLCGISAG